MSWLAEQKAQARMRAWEAAFEPGPYLFQMRTTVRGAAMLGDHGDIGSDTMVTVTEVRKMHSSDSQYT